MRLFCLLICCWLVDGCSSLRVSCNSRLRPINPVQAGASHAHATTVGETVHP